MAKRGPKPKEKTFEEEVWDNYNPYYKSKEPTAKEMQKRADDKTMERMNKNMALIAEMARYEASKSIITIISKKILSTVY